MAAQAIDTDAGTSRVARGYQSPSWHDLVRRAALGTVCFVAGFATVAVLLDAMVPPVRVFKVSDKIEMFQENGDGFDTLFLGSSRTGRQIIPAEFDLAMARAGTPTRSFNLGIEGLRPPGDTVVLEAALARRTRPLKFLVVECAPLMPLMTEEDKWTNLAIFTHDAKRMGVYWRQLWAPSLDEPCGTRAERRLEDLRAGYFTHVLHFIWNSARIGRGSDLLAHALTGVRRSNPPPLDGYYPRETELSPLKGAERKRYLTELAKQKAKPPGIGYWDHVSQDELKEKKSWADRFGATLVLVSPPFLKTRTFTPLDTRGIVYLDFSDANRYPEFHEPESRRDFGHLNDAASKRYSQEIAGRIVTALKPQPRQ